MAKDINEFIAKLPLAQRKKIEARAADLIVEELTLNNLQELTSRIAKLTPEKLAIVGKIVE
jgi:hypothetical protein